MQRPRILAAPPAVSSAAADEAIELAAMAGLELDEWQKLDLRVGLAENAAGGWAAFEVAYVVPRQNGKGGIFEARELAGLFLFGESLLIHSAHRFDTSLEAFLRILGHIEATPDLDARIRRVSRSHGEEGIELRTGQRLRFRTRSTAGGRGFSADFVGLDEAMYLSEGTMAALMPTMSTRANAQLWYAGSAVDAKVHEHGETLTRVRMRGLAGNDPSLAYMEHSADATMEQVEKGQVDLDDEVLWAQANPAKEIRISTEAIARERRSISARSFAIERLGIGDWPDVSEEGSEVIDRQVWASCLDPLSAPTNPVAFAVSMAEDRSRTAIGVAGRRIDGRIHGELLDDRDGNGWALFRLLALITKWDPCALVIISTDAAATLALDLDDEGIESDLISAREFALACGGWFDDVTGDRYRFRGDPAVTMALRAAKKRPLGGAWVWDQANSGYVAPLNVVTAARYGLIKHGRPAPAPVLAGSREGGRSSETADLAHSGF